MKAIMSLVLVAVLAVGQVILLPLNFTLLFILILISSSNSQLILILIVTASIFLSLFGGLGVGVLIMSFSAAALVFLIAKRYLPDKQIVKLSLLIFSLVFWEIMIRTSSAVFTMLT